MSEQKHSPTPWRVDYDSEKDDFGVTHRWVDCIVSIPAKATVCGSDAELADVDAEFIVRAVNCHDELVAEMKLIQKINASTGGGPLIMEGRRNIISDICARVLRKLEEKE